MAASKRPTVRAVPDMSPRPRIPSAWSTRGELWKRLAEITSGIEWQRVHLSPADAALVPANRTGVYVISVSPPHQPTAPTPESTSMSVREEYAPYGFGPLVASRTVIYAGQASSLRSGLRSRFQHHRTAPKPLLDRYLRCFGATTEFWYAEVRGAAELNRIEALLIGTFNPICNDIAAPGGRSFLATIGDPIPVSRLFA